MIEPLLRDDAFLEDVRRVGAAGDPDGVRLWWLGQSGFLIQHRGRHLLVDPYLSDSLTEKYAATDKPHVRLTHQVIDPSRLNFVHAVTASHQHTDHLDAPTLRALVAANPAIQIVVPAAHVALATERAGVPASRLIAVNAGDRFTVASGPLGEPGFEFFAIPSAHDQIECDAAGNHKYLGFIIRCAGLTIYHSGDTRLYPGLADKLAPFHIDLALLPINGHDPARRVAGNLSGAEAAGVARDIGARLVIPCHYEMFAFNTASVHDEFVPICRQLGQPFCVLRSGERFNLEFPQGRGKKV